MKIWDVTGEYLGRAVKATQLRDLRDPSLKDVSSSLVLIYFCSYCEEDDVSTYIRTFVEAEPLALAFAGACADKAFDEALQVLQTYQTKGHVMTMLCEENEPGEIFEGFLISTWPAEERFDEWDDYAIFALQCSDSSYVNLLAELRNLTTS